MTKWTTEEVKGGPDLDMCSCSECGWEGKITDCETVVDSEGWEYPEYHYQVCPACEDGGTIDNYWASEEDDDI